MKDHAPRLAVWAGAAVVSLLAFTAPRATATPVSLGVFTASDATGKSAKAEFFLDGNKLLVDLLNTAATATTSKADVLTAVFFTVSQDIVEAGSTLSDTGSAFVPGTNGSSAWDPADQHWARRTGSFTADQYTYDTTTASYKMTGTGSYNGGVGASGLGIFGNKYGVDHGAFASGGGNAAIGGVDYGLVSPSTTAAGVAGPPMSTGTPYLRNKVEAAFLFDTLNQAVPVSIKDVWFQYASALDEGGVPAEPPFPPVPEPAFYQMLVLLGLGAVGFVRRGRVQAATA